MSQFVFSGAANHMNFDDSVPEENFFGFGNAAKYIAKYMKKNNLSFIKGTDVEKINFNDRPKVNFSFCYPHEHQFHDYEYKIAYMPWESTELQPGWKEILEPLDEIWTTSEWCKKNLERILNRPVFVYNHGIPQFCLPKIIKEPADVIRFLHIGEPGIRKGAQDVVTSFIKLFGNNPKYQLVIKCTGINTTRILDDHGRSLGVPNSIYKNIIVLEQMLSEQQLIELYRKTHVFIYPSYGEGFGFNPAYALAMGIPTICTNEWAPYSQYITAPLDGRYIDSPWPILHPGQVIQPDLEQMEQHMINITQNYFDYSKLAFSNAFGIHEEFNWAKVSQVPAKRLKKIISMTSKN